MACRFDDAAQCRVLPLAGVAYEQPDTDESTSLHRRVGEQLRPIGDFLAHVIWVDLHFDSRKHVVRCECGDVRRTAVRQSGFADRLRVDEPERSPTVAADEFDVRIDTEMQSDVRRIRIVAHVASHSDQLLVRKHSTKPSC